MIFVATIISLFKEVLPNWTGPAYYGLILLTACYFSTRQNDIDQNELISLKIKAALILLLIIIVAGSITIKYYSGTIGKKDELKLGEGDSTLDMYEWKNLASQFKVLIDANERAGIIDSSAVIICNKWFPAAHIDFYVAMPLKKDLIVLGDTLDIHQYAWINKKRKPIAMAKVAYCIIPSDNYFNPQEYYAPYFKQIIFQHTFVQQRNGTD